MPSPERRGLFITLEGGDGSGKSTQAVILANRLRSEGRQVRTTQDPSGTLLGSLIMGFFQTLAAERKTIAPAAELMLFEAARAQLVKEVIKPALVVGEIVLADRFADSTLAYQGYGRGLDLNHVRACNDLATGGLKPELTLLFDLPPDTGLKRAAARKSKPRDSLGEETLEFHRRVREGYVQLARDERQRFAVIDATLPPEAVTEASWTRIKTLLQDRG